MRIWGLFLLALGLVAAGVSATDLAVTRLVFEKSAKMKRIDAALYMPFDDGVTGLACGVVARGRSGRTDASGTLRLRLTGETARAGESWESESVRASLDGFGEAGFDADELEGLAAEARAAGATRVVIRVDFDGGRGGRVEELTLDCLTLEG